MKIEILGTGCPKCMALEATVRDVVEEKKISCEIEKVSELNEIMAYGVLLTPAIVIDGEVKISGQLPTKEEIEKLF